LKVFLDTNVLASSIATRGLCAELLESVIHEHELLTGEVVLVELRRVLTEKLGLPPSVISGVLDLLRAEARLVESRQVPHIPIRDAADIPILACALAGEPDVFVTGDRELLELRNIENVAIISPRDLWDRLARLAERGKP